MNQGTGCKPWWGRINKQGYGVAYVAGKVIMAHRYCRMLVKGSYPQGVLHHLCGNPSCTNVAHLQELSQEQHRKLHSVQP